MAVDPVFELEGAILARLRSYTDVTALVGARIYDRPPGGDVAATYPFISIGPSDAVSDDADCVDGYEITMQIDCWSSNSGEAYSSAEVRKLAGAVRRALTGADITLTTNALVTVDHRTTRFFRQSDDTINTAAVTITALVEET